MSTTSVASPGHAEAGSSMSVGDFVRTYVFSLDHKIIGLQFLFSTLLWFLVGGLLALGIRWQLAWPWRAKAEGRQASSHQRRDGQNWHDDIEHLSP